MGEQPQIDPESWWQDPLADALSEYLDARHRATPGERFPVADEETRALIKLELLLQARAIRELDRAQYEISPLVRALAEVVGAAEAYIKEQAIAALSPS